MGRSSDNLGQEVVHAFFAEGSLHGGEDVLVRAHSDDCWVPEAKVEGPLKIELVSGLEPEESEWLLPLMFGNCHESVEVSLSLSSVTFVNIGQEGHHADSGALAVLIVYFLLDKLVKFWGDVSFLNKFKSLLSDR